jgi:hypothetical protein
MMKKELIKNYLFRHWICFRKKRTPNFLMYRMLSCNILEAMTSHFDRYIPENVTNRVGSAAHLIFTSKIWLMAFQVHFIEIQNDVTMRCGFKKQTVDYHWCVMDQNEKGNTLLWNEVVEYLLRFSKSCFCEEWFSALATIWSKLRRQQTEHDLDCSISITCPRI